MALFNQFCTKHNRWTHTIPCLYCDLEAEREEFRKKGHTLRELDTLPVRQRAALFSAIAAGDERRTSEILRAAPFLTTNTVETVLEATRQAHWALQEGGDLPIEAEANSPKEQPQSNAFRLWPESWREATGLLLLSGAVFCALYLFLRLAGCPPPPGMP